MNGEMINTLLHNNTPSIYLEVKNKNYLIKIENNIIFKNKFLNIKLTKSNHEKENLVLNGDDDLKNLLLEDKPKLTKIMLDYKFKINLLNSKKFMKIINNITSDDLNEIENLNIFNLKYYFNPLKNIIGSIFKLIDIKYYGVITLNNENYLINSEENKNELIKFLTSIYIHNKILNFDEKLQL